MKRCFKCLCEKPLADFYRHAQMADGHLNKCKECTKSDVKKHRQDEWERVRAYDRMRGSQPHRIAKTKILRARWRLEHPERSRAQTALEYAVKVGKVKKTVCWVCGEDAEAHHPDYSRPLDVVWLCRAHHRQTHALVSNEPSIKRAA